MNPVWLGAAGTALAAAASCRWNWWRPPSDGLPVLMYHQIGKAPASARFEAAQ